MKKVLGQESPIILVKLTQLGSISISIIQRPKSNSLILIPSSILWLWMNGIYLKRNEKKQSRSFHRYFKKK